jgi:hypothetical protein
MRIEAPFEYAHIRICGKDSERSICATAVNYDDILRPPEPGQSSANIPLFIVSQQNWCNVIKHSFKTVF